MIVFVVELTRNQDVKQWGSSASL